MTCHGHRAMRKYMEKPQNRESANLLESFIHRTRLQPMQLRNYEAWYNHAESCSTQLRLHVGPTTMMHHKSAHQICVHYMLHTIALS